LIKAGFDTEYHQYKKVIYSACFFATNSKRMDDGMAGEGPILCY